MAVNVTRERELSQPSSSVHVGLFGQSPLGLKMAIKVSKFAVAESPQPVLKVYCFPALRLTWYILQPQAGILELAVAQVVVGGDSGVS